MSKIAVAGNAVVVTSKMSLEDIKTLEKYRPSALKLMGGENGKEELFRVMSTKGMGEIDSCGAAFGQCTHDEAKNACITLVFDKVEGDLKEVIADKLGAAKTKLDQIEETVPAVLAEVKAERAAIMDGIEFVGSVTAAEEPNAAE